MMNSAYNIHNGQEEAKNSASSKENTYRSQLIRAWKNEKHKTSKRWEDALEYTHGMEYNNIFRSYDTKTRQIHARAQENKISTGKLLDNIDDAKSRRTIERHLQRRMDGYTKEFKDVVHGWRQFKKDGVARPGSKTGYIEYIPSQHRVVTVTNDILRARLKKRLQSSFNAYQKDMRNMRHMSITAVVREQFEARIPGIAEYIATYVQENPTYANSMTGPMYTAATTCASFFGIAPFKVAKNLGVFGIPLTLALQVAEAHVKEKITMRGRKMLQQESTKQTIRDEVERVLREGFATRRGPLARVGGALSRAFSMVIAAGVNLSSKSTEACPETVIRMVSYATERILAEFLKDRIQYLFGQDVDHKILITLVKRHTSTITKFLQGHTNVDDEILSILEYMVDIVPLTYVKAYFGMQ